MCAAVAAGVSVISGIGGIISKNKEASAQREQLQAQQYQAAVQSAAQQEQLKAQQILARQEYQMGVLASISTYNQAKVGLNAQRIQADAEAQQQQYAASAQGLTAASQLTQQQADLERQRVNIQVGTDQQLGQSAQRQTGVSEQLVGAIEQAQQQLSEKERRAVSQQAMGKLTSTSSLAKKDRDLMQTVADAFSQGLQIDRTQALSELQGFNEEELASIAEQLGLNDNQRGIDTVTANSSLNLINTRGAVDAAALNRTSTLAALDSANSTTDFGQSMQGQSRDNSYAAQDFSLGVQRGLNTATNQSVQSSFGKAISNVRGAGFLDYLNAGVNAYGAVSPLLRRSPTVGGNTVTTPNQATQLPLYSGIPSAFQNYG